MRIARRQNHQRRHLALLVLGRARAALAGPEAGDIHKLDRLGHEVREVILGHAGRRQTGLPAVATHQSGDTEIVSLIVFLSIFVTFVL